WIEYVNRLLGATIGLLIIGTFIFSIGIWKMDKTIVITSFFNIILVSFQGWIGSIVVSTNLLPWMITLHMVLALVLVCLLLLVHYRSIKLAKRIKPQIEKAGSLFFLLMVAFILMIIQVVLGTQVREQVDLVALKFGNMFRSGWVDHLGINFIIHRSFSLVLLLIHLAFLYFMYK